MVTVPDKSLKRKNLDKKVDYSLGQVNGMAKEAERAKKPKLPKKRFLKREMKK